MKPTPIDVVADSNILFAYLKQHEPTQAWLRAKYPRPSRIGVTPVTLVEACLSKYPDKVKKEISELLQVFCRLHIDETVWHTARMVALKWDHSHEFKTALGMADFLIGVTAIRFKVPVITRDRKFELIPGLEVIAPPN